MIYFREKQSEHVTISFKCIFKEVCLDIVGVKVKQTHFHRGKHGIIVSSKEMEHFIIRKPKRLTRFEFHMLIRMQIMLKNSSNYCIMINKTIHFFIFLLLLH